MNDFHELSQTTTALEFCPVFIVTSRYDDSDPIGYRQCGTRLQVMYTRTVMGDDYSEQVQHGVYFDCGHSIKDMESALSMEEFL